MFLKLFIIAPLLGLAARNLVAQPYVVAHPDASQLVGLEIRANPILHLTAYYGHTWSEVFGTDNEMSLLTSVGSPLFLVPDFDSFDATLSGIYRISLAEAWQVGIAVTGLGTRAKNLNARMLGLSSELTVLPGYRWERGYLSGWLGVQGQWAAHLWHRAYAKEAFADRYPGSDTVEPQDGWYGLTSFIGKAGLGGGYTWSRIGIQANLGFQYIFNELGILSLPDVAVLPFFAGVSLTYHW